MSTAPKIEVKAQSGYQLITLPDLSQKEISRALEIESKQWLVLSEKVYAWDFSRVFIIEQSILTQLLQILNQMKKAEKTVYSINIKSNLERDLKSRGVWTSLHVMQNLEELEETLNPKPKSKAKKIDISMLKPFVEGAAKAFEVQVKIKIEAGKPGSKKHSYEANDAVVGQVKVDVEGFHGTISVCFSEPVFLAVYKALLGEELTKIDKDSADAAGELINIIYGHAKTALNKSHGLTLKPSLPIIHLQPGIKKESGSVITLPFSSPIGDFRVEVLIT